ncbi:MAG: tellurite resistance protein [Flavobacteriales bacterium]|jgi:tellurite resistance protein|tara:strand:- start:707 stop:1138 length:432 start_codon:yes stop_codon:yes gene_type:complete
MNTNKPTPHHLFCFVYIGFSHLSNDTITEEIIEEIERKIASWMNVNPTNIVEFNKVIQESYDWYNSLKSDEKLGTVLNVAKSIKEITGFNVENKKTFLSDIRDIAVADGRFSEDEKNMHDMIAKELGINIMTTEKDIQKKIGF